MHLSTRQLDRFFDLLDSLLVFANRRLSLVNELALPIVGEEAEMKAAFVCEALWANREVIDEYVRANPGGLSARDLQAVAAWSDALAGDFTLVEHRDGRAMMMHETGMYAVCGLDRDLSERLPQAPDILHAVLLPFEGIIVTDGLEAGSGFPLNEEELREMREERIRAEARGVAVTADELRRRAAEHNRRIREREFDDLLASVEREARQSREGERLPEGYHRGALAGLDGDERAKALAEYYAGEAGAADAPHGPGGEAGPAHPAGAPGLAGTGGRAASAGGADAAESGAAADAETMQPAAAFPAHGRQDASFEEDSTPPWLEDADPALVAYEVERDEAVLNCADALVQMCGMMTLKEAYAAYRAAVLDVVPLARFVAVLMQEDVYESAEFSLQEWHGQSYLMHFSISDAYAREWVAQEKARSVAAEGAAVASGAEAAAFIARLADEVSHELEAELEALEEYRAHLLECQRRTERRPLDPRAAEGAYLEALAERPAMVQLRAFLDAHVPDGEDDFTYADRALEELMLHSIDNGDVLGFLDEVERLEASACTEDPDLFLRLVENAYGALPSWEFNGWSPQEAMEKLMGRRIFYNVRGEMMHPAPGDACPCGSGKPYGECHGA